MGPRHACAVHGDRPGLGPCRNCSTPVCALCAIPSDEGLLCPECHVDAATVRARPLLAPLPGVAGWLALGTGAASLVHGVYLAPALGAGSAALAWGLFRHLGLPPGAPADRSILAWALGAGALALCGLKIHLYGPGSAGLLSP